MNLHRTTAVKPQCEVRKLVTNHIPVLLKEVLYYLNPKPGENFIDCTIGFGGHTFEIAERIAPNGKVLGIELDKEVLKETKLQASSFKFGKNIVLHNGNFTDLKNIVAKYNFSPVNGVLFDLGMSSWHLEKSGRGFSFLRDEPLLMNYELNNKLTAMEIVNHWHKKDLIKIFREYGEEKYSKRIAEEIVKQRKNKPIITTFQLVEIVRGAVPRRYRYKRTHFATRIFQALRIAVNDELSNLQKALFEALKILSPQGRLVIISFHSLEDRIVKNFFKQQDKLGNLKILTKKPVVPTKEEIRKNRRSRSAKLRAGVKQ